MTPEENENLDNVLEWTLTQEQIEAYVSYPEYHKIWACTTVCLLKLKNWFELVWLSHVFDPKHFDEKIWEEIAYNDAFNKLAEFVAFDLKNQKAAEDVLVPDEE